MIDDFRNTGLCANAVSEQYLDGAGDQKLAVFVGTNTMGKGQEVDPRPASIDIARHFIIHVFDLDPRCLSQIA
jgi:hypothetical protein